MLKRRQNFVFINILYAFSVRLMRRFISLLTGLAAGGSAEFRLSLPLFISPRAETDVSAGKFVKQRERRADTVSESMNFGKG